MEKMYNDTLGKVQEFERVNIDTVKCKKVLEEIQDNDFITLIDKSGNTYYRNFLLETEKEIFFKKVLDK